MNTIILYGTKYGAAGELAKRVAEKMGGAALHNLSEGGAPSLDVYDCVIVGSSIYAGAIRKAVKDFVNENRDALLNKTLGLFLCGLDGGKDMEYFNGNFPAEIISHTKAAMFLGGVFEPKKAKLKDRLAIWMITKQSGRVDSTDEGKVDEFVTKMKA